MQRVIVDPGPCSHPIYIGQGVFNSAGETRVSYGLPGRKAGTPAEDASNKKENKKRSA
ncbi:MAG: hypothetical protein ABSF91_00005 [Bacteroidota bacterium]